MKEDTESISDILEYPIDANGSLVTRRGGLTRMKPKLDAPPPSQIGSVDWTMCHMFGDREKAVEIIESLVSGQGENADEKWVRFVLLYRQWEIQYRRGDLEVPPNLNQVCHSLNFDARELLGELQMGMRGLFTKIGAIKATMEIPAIVDKVIEVALSDEGDKGDRELALKLGGMIEDKSGMNVNIHNTNQNAIMLKGEKDRMKSPLLQFSDTVIDIDDEVRKEDDKTTG
jgi:hypothetical protein